VADRRNELAVVGLLRCLDIVAVLRRPGANLQWATFGPIFFPKWTQFEEALNAIGYPETVQTYAPPDQGCTDFFL
jgi:hypothetical protein